MSTVVTPSTAATGAAPSQGGAQHPSRLPALIRLPLQALVWLALAVVMGLLAAMVVVPLVMHWVPLTVLSGSMEPTIPIGSQVVVERVQGEKDTAKLQKGDVITFLPEPNNPRLVTHRIIAVTATGDGQHAFHTQGDANSAADPWRLTQTQIRGKVMYHIPKVGYLAQGLNQTQKSRGILVVAGALFGYAALQLGMALRARRREQGQPGRHRANSPSAGQDSPADPGPTSGGVG